MKRNKFMAFAFAALAAGALTTSCSDNDNNNSSENTPQVNPAETQFIVASGDPTSDLTGGIAMKTYTDMTASWTNQSIYGNEDAVKIADSFTQETYNSETGIFTGYIYARAAGSEENGGIGSMKAGLRSYKIVDGKLQQVGSPVYLNNFGNTGTFGRYSYAAQISNPVVVRIDENGVGKEITLDIAKLAIGETNPSVSNIVDMGNNQVAMILTYSGIDEAYVAIADYDLNVSKVIKTDKIGPSVGAMRSVRYSQSAADDDGNVYVFCGGSESEDNKVGAVRINKGTTEFDSSYKFDILSKANGLRFRKVFHISGDDFLIEFYNDADKHGNMDASGKMAVVNMTNQTLNWVTGLPDPTTVSIVWGDGFNGAYYLPTAAPTSMSGGGGQGGGGGRPHSVSTRATSTVIPTIWKIDAKTGVATSFMTFATSDLLKAIKIVK